MSDDKGGAPLHQRVHTLLNEFLGAGVDAACRLVENQYWRIGDCSPGNSQQLTFSLTQIAAIGIQYGLITVAQALDKAIGINEFCGLDAVLIAGCETTVAYVVHHRTREQVCLLEHHSQSVTQITLADVVHADSVNSDFAVLDIIEAVDQVSDGRFAGTSATDKGDLLVGHGIKVNIE